jgi:protein tyrosine/serine phosphatase
MKKIFNILFAAVLLTACTGIGASVYSADSGAASNPPAKEAKRPDKWAVPISRPGLSNFFKVSEDLYRGAKPEAQGFAEMKKLGVKTVVNLETFHSDRERLEESKSNLAYEHIFMKAWNAEDEDIVRFLKIVTDKSKTPVFVHCYHGSDRTGTMVAVYRIFIQGWTKEEAIRELKDGGYGFHVMWVNLEDYLKNLDVEKIKKEAGIVRN